MPLFKKVFMCHLSSLAEFPLSIVFNPEIANLPLVLLQTETRTVPSKRRTVRVREEQEV